MLLDFEKWHGCSNDFIVTWIKPTEKDFLLHSLQRSAPQLCSRGGTGIGADGILVILGDTLKPALEHELVIINSDGTLAKNCGNGLRCAASSAYGYLCQFLREEPSGMQFQVAGQPFACRFMDAGDNEMWVAVDMPTAVCNEENPWHVYVEKVLQKHITPARRDLPWGSCDVGNKHIALYGEDFSVDELRQMGPKVQEFAGGDGINFHLCMIRPVVPAKIAALAQKVIGEKVDAHLDVLTWERGAGETKACGSGATAAACLAMEQGEFASGALVSVGLPGGTVFVKLPDDFGAPTLIGPAKKVFKGQLDF